MAKISYTSTSGRVEAHIRGRVMRSQDQPRAGNREPRERSKERRRVCVLTERGGRELEHWGMEQPCFGPGCHHLHQSREAVSKLVADGILRWCGIGKNVAMYVYGREWRGVPSGPGGRLAMRAMQLV